MIWQIMDLVLVFSACVSVFIAFYAWRHREIAGAKIFVWLVSAFAIWSVVEALIVHSLDLSVMLWLTKIQYIGIATVPVFWLIFAVEYSGNSDWLGGQYRILLFLIPGIVLFAVWTTEFHPLFYQDFGEHAIDDIHLFQSTPGMIYWLNLIYSYSLFVIGMALIIRMFVTSPPQYSRQIGIIIIGAIIPMLGNIIYNFGQGRTMGIDLTPLFFTITGVMIFWSLFRYQFLGITPIARSWVIENMQDGMLVIDIQNQIVDINPAMEIFLGTSDRKVIGKTVDQVLAHLPDLISMIQTNTDLRTELSIAADDIQWNFDLLISPILDQHNASLGKLVELRDISTYQRALADMNRYAAENAQLLEAESRQRQLAESLLQTMIILSSSLDRDEIVKEILAQLRIVLPYHSAALYLLDGDELRLEKVVGPEKISDKSYTTPRRHDQIQKIFQLKTAEVFMSSYSQNPESRGDPVYSSMAAPLVVGQEALGVLTIDRFEPMPFVQENAEILQAYTNQAAIAIKNAEYFQQSAATAAMEERNRLAQDLHDAVNQTLFTASIMAEALPRVWEEDPDQGRQGLLEIRRLTRAALSEMRTLLVELHPQRITEKNIGALLDHLARSVSNRMRIPIELEIVNDTILDPEIQVPFYRIAQEAFNNIMKHANATHCWVILDAQLDQAYLSIRDDGLGFDPELTLPGHYGMEIMKKRAEGIKANLNINSQTNQGTELVLVWQRKMPGE